MTPRDLRKRVRDAVYLQSPENAVRRMLRAGVDRMELLQTISDLSYGAMNEGDYAAYMSMLKTAENYTPRARRNTRTKSRSRAHRNPIARDNFFGMFKSGPPAEQFDLDEHVEIARGLAGQTERVREYLVHAPGKRGLGRAWYWIPGIGKRAFTDAKSGSFPKRYIKSSSPWNTVRSNLSMYRDGNTRPFVVIDTFSGTVEGPLTLAQIEGRQNPRRRALARRNGSPDNLLHVTMANLLRHLQTIKVGAQINHWNAHGPSGYSEHLLYERIYGKMDKLIDTLAEKYVAYTGKPVPVKAMTPKPDVHDVAATIEETKIVSDLLRQEANKQQYMDSLASVAGLDDYLMSLNNKLDTFEYLLTRVQTRK